MANQKKHRWLPYLMVLPAFSIMVLVVVFPIVNTVARSFRTADGQFTLDNYAYFFTSAEALQSLLFTLAEALTVMALSVVLSFLLALYLRFSKSPVSRALGKLYLLPRFIPGIAAVYAVMNVIKDSGSINRIAAAFGVDYKPGLLYDLKGIILSNLWFCIPFAAMMMSAALSSVNDSYVESARDAGCSWRDVLCRIILPLTYKDVIVSATFILMGQVGAFTIPYLTGPNNPKMLGILLYQQTGTYMNYERAAALSVLMFLICLGGAIVYIRSNMKGGPAYRRTALAVPHQQKGVFDHGADDLCQRPSGTGRYAQHPRIGRLPRRLRQEDAQARLPAFRRAFRTDGQRRADAAGLRRMLCGGPAQRKRDGRRSLPSCRRTRRGLLFHPHAGRGGEPGLYGRNA